MFHVWDDHVSVENEVYMEDKNKFYKNFKQKFVIDSKQVLPKYFTYTILMQCLPNIFTLFLIFQTTLETEGRCIRGATLKNEKKMLILLATSYMHFKSDNVQQLSWEKTMEQNGLWEATLMPF